MQTQLGTVFIYAAAALQKKTTNLVPHLSVYSSVPYGLPMQNNQYGYDPLKTSLNIKKLGLEYDCILVNQCQCGNRWWPKYSANV